MKDILYICRLISVISAVCFMIVGATMDIVQLCFLVAILSGQVAGQFK